jgi:hypothetical protein
MSFARAFPSLTPENHSFESPADKRYNCIAWAAGETARYWWPDSMDQAYWPPGVPREETIEAFVQAYATLGYVPCDSADLEPGFEKTAIYASGATPTHAARQLPSGVWTSKLGPQEDIEHTTPEAVEGPEYGKVAVVLRRPVA